MAIRALITPTFYVLHDPDGVVQGKGQKVHFFGRKQHAVAAWSEGGLRYKASAHIEKYEFDDKCEMWNFANNLILGENDV